MATFTYSFTLPVSRQAVADFHHDTSVLKKLNPPGIFIQFHAVEPLAEGSRSEFTMWFGPVPVRWVAVHQDVSDAGFTDVQVQGPLAKWQHTHRYTALDDGRTRVDEKIEFEYPQGPRGLLTRALFNPLGLTALFTYRQLVTRLALVESERRRAQGLAALTGVLATALVVAGLLRRKKERT